MSGVDPDVVENDIGVVWRTLYKLEKGFSENPSALKMAQKVKGRVDDFKEYLGLIAALFNPGLRERHWDKMSEIASQDLKPNEVRRSVFCREFLDTLCWFPTSAHHLKNNDSL